MVVLLVLAAITALVFEAQWIARRQMEQAERAALRAKLQLAATDALQHGIERLARDADLAVDHTNEEWAATATWEDPQGIKVHLWVVDENRYFDINNIVSAPGGEALPPAEILHNVFALCGDFESAARMEALRDWTDEDSAGAWESDYYRKLDPSYAAANRVLLTFTELLHVRGFSRSLFERRARYGRPRSFEADLLDCVTILPHPRSAPIPVNVNTAGPEVLQAVLGLDQADVVAALCVRRERAPIASADMALDLVPPARARAVRAYVGVNSTHFTLEARADGGGQMARARALVRRDADGRIEVVQWQISEPRV